MRGAVEHETCALAAFQSVYVGSSDRRRGLEHAARAGAFGCPGKVHGASIKQKEDGTENATLSDTISALNVCTVQADGHPAV